MSGSPLSVVIMRIEALFMITRTFSILHLARGSSVSWFKAPGLGRPKEGSSLLSQAAHSKKAHLPILSPAICLRSV